MQVDSAQRKSDDEFIELMRGKRQALNKTVLKNAKKEKPYAADLTKQVLEEWEIGAMKSPSRAVAGLCSSRSYTRRIPVRELKQGVAH